jgi:hypothetical protein
MLVFNSKIKWNVSLDRHLWADFLEKGEALTSHNPMGLHGLL